MALTPDQLREYARMGAAVRLAQLSDEIKLIHAAFPELRARTSKASDPSAVGSASASNEPTTRKRRRRKLTAAEKKLISERMKKYWAARKKRPDATRPRSRGPNAYAI
jgi:hypothetical protein